MRSPFSTHETVVFHTARRRPFRKARYLLTSRPFPACPEADGREEFSRVLSLYAEYRDAHTFTFASISDFTADEAEALRFARRMAKEFVLPETLRDVYEDLFF